MSEGTAGNPTRSGRVETGIKGLMDLRRVWVHVLCYALATRAVLTILVILGLAFVLRVFMSGQGRKVLYRDRCAGDCQ